MQEVAVTSSVAPAQNLTSPRRPRATSRRAWRVRAGWVAVCLSTATASVYGWWGIVQNFTMGWYASTTPGNILLMLAYLSPLLVILGLAVCAVRFPDAAFAGHALVATGLCAWLFHQSWTEGHGLPLDHRLATAAIMAVAGLLYSFGRPEPRSRAYLTILAVPLAITLASGIGPALRAHARQDDGNRAARVVVGNGVTLVWAPEGPGWSQTPVTWHEAVRIAAHLSEDGRTVTPTPVNVWRLPTVAELVQSLSSRDTNAGGEWDPWGRTARYLTTPTKESPLWDVRSPIIYWWTATQPDGEEHAYAVCFNGRVVLSPTKRVFRGRGFRAMRSPGPPSR